jgi:hypothetical protein
MNEGTCFECYWDNIRQSRNVTLYIRTNCRKWIPWKEIENNWFWTNLLYTYNTLQKKRKHLLQRNNRLSRKCGLVSGANIRKGDTIKLFDVPFSQFIKIESDFRHYYKLGPDSQIASRIIAGAGFAYGNSEKCFINSSLVELIVYALLEHVLSDREVWRCFNKYQYVFTRSIWWFKMEFNTEYRAKIYGLVKGALFIDAGNICEWESR